MDGERLEFVISALSRIGPAVQDVDSGLSRIIERGTHRELLDRAGAYAQMWALQLHDQERKDEERQEYEHAGKAGSGVGRDLHPQTA